MMQIKKVKIENFKRIKNAEINIDDITLLIGGNNSGKTSFLQGVHFFYSILESAWLNKPSGKKPAKTLSPNQILYLPCDNPYKLPHNHILTQNNGASIQFIYEDDTEEVKEKEFRFSIFKGKNANISLNFNERDRFFKEFVARDKVFSIFVPGLAGIPIKEEYRNEGLVRRIISQGNSNNYLRNIILMIERESKVKELLELINIIFPHIKNIDVEFNEKIDTNVNVYINEKSIELLGTGILQIIHICSYVVKYKPYLLLLDEPDSHLHPSNQKLLPVLFNKINDDYKTKILLSTHSRHLFSAITKSNVSIYRFAEKGAQKARSDEREVLDILFDIGALDNFDKITASEYIFFIEDARGEYIRKAIIDTAKKYGIKENKISIISFYGVNNIKNLKLTIEIFKNNFGRKRYCILADGDCLLEEEKNCLEEKIKSEIGVDFIFLDYSDQEGYYIFNCLLNDPNIKDEIKGILNYINQDEKIRGKLIASIATSRQEVKNNMRALLSKNEKGSNCLQSNEKLDYSHNTPIKLVKGKKLLKIIKNALNKQNKLQDLTDCNTCEIISNRIARIFKN